MKKRNILIASSALIILGLYYFYKESKQEAKPIEEPKQEEEEEKADWDKVLKKGSTGKEVGLLQKALKQIAVDEDFGKLTEERLKRVTGLTEISINEYNKIINKK